MGVGQEVARAIEHQEMEAERLLNRIRFIFAALAALLIVVAGSAQSKTSLPLFCLFPLLQGGYAVVVRALLRTPRYRPRLKYASVTVDLLCVYLLTVASLFNHSGVYEAYRAPMAWILLGLTNGLTALRYSVRVSLYGAILTLVLGALELAGVARWGAVPWSSQAEYLGPGINPADAAFTFLFASFPGFAAALVAAHARRVVTDAATATVERAHADERHQRTLEEVEGVKAIAAMKEEFFSVASHELRTPVTTLRLTAARLVEDPALAEAPPATRKAIERLDGQTGRLVKLVEHLLDGVRLGNPEVALERGPADLVAICRNIVADLDPERRTRVRLEIEAERLEGEWDTSRLEQVISNLVVNALRYSEQMVRVRVHAADGRALVTVTDEGIGIPEAQRAKLFTPFFRAANARALRKDGLGLGLYIAHEIMRRHGGRLTVASEEGRGSTFTVELPGAR